MGGGGGRGGGGGVVGGRGGVGVVGGVGGGWGGWCNVPCLQHQMWMTIAVILDGTPAGPLTTAAVCSRLVAAAYVLIFRSVGAPVGE